MGCSRSRTLRRLPFSLVALISAGVFLLFLFGAVAMAGSDITVRTGGAIGAASFWHIRHMTGSAVSAYELKAAPGAATYLNVTHLIASSDAATAIYLQDEDDGVIAGGYEFTTTGPGTIAIEFPFPRQLPANKALEVIATDTGNVTVEVEGFTSE